MEQLVKTLVVGIVSGFAFRAGMHAYHKASTPNYEKIANALEKREAK